MRLSALQT
jgi:putative ABC transport system permease protein